MPPDALGGTGLARNHTNKRASPAKVDSTAFNITFFNRNY
jgi:hypothetical protein